MIMLEKSVSEFFDDYYMELRGQVTIYGDVSQRVKYLEQDIKAMYAEIARLRTALEQIADPISFAQKNLPKSDPDEFQQKSENVHYLKSLAWQALRKSFPKISRKED
ncbi:MAG: hypothetical protein ACO22R_07905 [Chitinophagaceae bacterium]